MKVLVTGGAGFIGSNLCRTLLADGHVTEIRVLDDLSTGFEANMAGLDLDFRRGTILDRDLLHRSSRGVDAIVHLAALGSVPRSIENPRATHDANVTGTLEVLMAARRVGAHVVVASSSSVYGSNPAMPKTEDLQCRPASPYAVSKLAAEQYALSFGQVYELPVLPFRFFNVYGPRQRPGHAYAAVIPVFLDAALRGQPLPVHGDGEQSRDFTYVETVTEILRRSVVNQITGGPMNLAFGARITLMEIVRLIESAMGVSLERVHSESRLGDVRHSQADNSTLLANFPGVRAVGIEEGIASSLAWMREHHAGEQRETADGANDVQGAP